MTHALTLVALAMIKPSAEAKTTIPGHAMVDTNSDTIHDDPLDDDSTRLEHDYITVTPQRKNTNIRKNILANKILFTYCTAPCIPNLLTTFLLPK